MTLEREAMTPTKIGNAWMQDAEHCISVARAVAVDCMNALGMDADDFRTRDKIISAISTRIDQSMDAAADHLSRAAEPVAWRITNGEMGYNFTETPPREFDQEWAARYGRKYEPLYINPSEVSWPIELQDIGLNDIKSIVGYLNDIDSEVARITGDEGEDSSLEVLMRMPTRPPEPAQGGAA